MRSLAAAGLLALAGATAVHGQALAPRSLGTPDEDFSNPLVGYRLVRGQLEPSYITAMGGLGNLPNLLFEADIAPHFAFGWNNVALVATAKVILRMLNDSTGSAPVRSPSYMPRLAFYMRTAADSTHANILSFTLSHHSNGQAGPFYDANGEPNTLDGSFSTNYVELGFQHVYKVQDRGIGWVGIALRQHIPINEDTALRVSSGNNQYGRTRLILTASSRRLSALLPVKLPVATQYQYFYILDGTYQGHDFVSGKRFGMSVTLDVTTRSDALLGGFLTFYMGPDYYNMSYKNYVTALRVGLAVQSITSFHAPD